MLLKFIIIFVLLDNINDIFFLSPTSVNAIYQIAKHSRVDVVQHEMTQHIIKEFFLKL